MKISEIKLNKKNPRLIKDYKFEKLKKSITEFPKMLELRPIIIDNDNIILGGNMRYQALKDLGYKELPDNWVKKSSELSEEEKQRFILIDNVNFGEFDFEIIANEWDSELIADWGLDVPSFELEAEQLEAVEDDFDTTPPEIPITVLGDLYEIGEHRLLCGDSTESDQVAKLMNNQKADMVFTDPPYGIGYEYNTHKDTKGEEYLKFCEEWFNVLQLNCELIIITTGWSYKKFWWNKSPSDELVWFDKTKQSGGRSYYLRKTEPIFIFGKIKEKYTWDILEIQSNRGDGIRELHTCPKPIALIEDIIKPQTINNSIILDVFLGSGTTMVASHQLKRKCYGMELDPKYCDVIVKRMIKLDNTLIVKRNGIDVTKEFKE